MVLPRDRAEVVHYPAETIYLRAVGHGDIQVADYIGTDAWVRGGVGTVQLLPKGVPHTLRVPEGSARLIQVSIGPPYDGFA